MKSLIVSLHDIHPNSLHYVMEQREALQSIGVTQCSLLMVPKFHHEIKILDSSEMIAWGTQAQQGGDELVLHGYYHDRVGQNDSLNSLFWTRFYSNKEAEFYDLNEMKARERLDRGRQLFKECGWDLKGFIAPAWLMTPQLPSILRSMGFAYTNTLRGIVVLQPSMKWVQARSLCWSVRAGWRRLSSLAWNGTIFGGLKRHSVLRVSLHPKDFKYVAIRKQIMNLVKRALDEGFQPLSYASYVAR